MQEPAGSMTSRRGILLAAAGIAACAGTPTIGSEPDALRHANGPAEVLTLWPDGPPGGVPTGLIERIVERPNPLKLLDRAAHDVTTPSLSLFPSRQPDGSALILIPGGGYRWVVIDKEGYEGARIWTTPDPKRTAPDVFVLRYRLPHQGWQAGHRASLEDAERAMTYVRAWLARHRAALIDGEREALVNVCGFSAGGHLAGWLGFTGQGPTRPDRLALIYPVALLEGPHAHAGSVEHLLARTDQLAQATALSLPALVTADAPPTLLVHAADDTSVPVENAVAVWSRLRAVGVRTALHVFDAGGHGFGIRSIANSPRAVWPRLLADWCTA